MPRKKPPNPVLAALHEIRDAVLATNERVDALGDRLDTVAARVSDVGRRVDALSERVDALSGRVDALGERIEAVRLAQVHSEIRLATELVALNGTLQTAIAFERRIAALEAKVG